ncbi:hypothetical protein PHYPSEUDO_015239 [Phytophthora pseudosyringae]|uniref:Chromo domain-containing protein n=1 Tax=Phytophthora pseudosyringae TaxID=221518 RepID=A0A8T1V8A5_9STRA|nr:hypothetical protein PHYPSEUDO_015239 [Phytophthora pseudosyringae]
METWLVTHTHEEHSSGEGTKYTGKEKLPVTAPSTTTSVIRRETPVTPTIRAYSATTDVRFVSTCSSTTTLSCNTQSGQVFAIIDRKDTKAGYWYRVQWCDESGGFRWDDTWEPDATHFCFALELLLPYKYQSRMRVHNALWVLAETKGNDRARKYAQERKHVCSIRRTKPDTKWLCGHGGTRLRKMGFSLPLEEREQLMKADRDSTFPKTTNGVLDERLKHDRKHSSSQPNLKLNSDVQLVSNSGVEEKPKSTLAVDSKPVDHLVSMSED